MCCGRQLRILAATQQLDDEIGNLRYWHSFSISPFPESSVGAFFPPAASPRAKTRLVRTGGPWSGVGRQTGGGLYARPSSGVCDLLRFVPCSEILLFGYQTPPSSLSSRKDLCPPTVHRRPVEVCRYLDGGLYPPHHRQSTIFPGPEGGLLRPELVGAAGAAVQNPFELFRRVRQKLVAEHDSKERVADSINQTLTEIASEAGE